MPLSERSTFDKSIVVEGNWTAKLYSLPSSDTASILHLACQSLQTVSPSVSVMDAPNDNAQTNESCDE